MGWKLAGVVHLMRTPQRRRTCEGLLMRPRIYNRTLKYRTQEAESRTMLPSGGHIVDKHGTIYAPKLTMSKRERAKIKRQAKRAGGARKVGLVVSSSERIGGFFA